MRNKTLSLMTVLAVGLSIAVPAAAKGPKPKPPPEPASMTLTLTCHLKDLGSHDWFPGGEPPDSPFPHLDADLAFVGFGNANYTLRIDVGDIVDGEREGPIAGYSNTGFHVPASGEYPDPESGDILYLDFFTEAGGEYWGVATLDKGRKRVAISDVEITC